MEVYRLRFTYVQDDEPSVFLTWRLHDSLLPDQGFPADARNSGQAFAATDRLLDEARVGPLHLTQPAVAQMIVEAICHNGEVLGHFRLHAFVVMPNHVHLLASPAVALPDLLESLKGVTDQRASELLGLTAGNFWQEASYAREVRYEREFEDVCNYIEGDPVRGGLVREASEYPWSSAAADAIIPEGTLWRFTSIRSSRDGWNNSLTWQGA